VKRKYKRLKKRFVIKIKKLHNRLMAIYEKRGLSLIGIFFAIWSTGIGCILGGLKCEVTALLNFGFLLLLIASVYSLINVYIICFSIIKLLIFVFKALRKYILRRRAKKVWIIRYENNDVSYTKYEDNNTSYVKYEDSETYYEEYKNIK